MKHYNTLYDLLKMNLNNKTKYELKLVFNNSIQSAVDLIHDFLKTKSIRFERRKMMIDILKYLYKILINSKNNQVCPSMKTIAYQVNNQNITSEKQLHAKIMRVQRAIKTLELLNIIKIHKYYISESHFNSNKFSCYFYELKPFLSFLSNIYITKESEEQSIKLVEEYEIKKSTKGEKINGFLNVMEICNRKKEGKK